MKTWIVLCLSLIMQAFSLLRYSKNLCRPMEITRRYLNRVMLEENELHYDEATQTHFSKLQPDDYRTKHIQSILKLNDRDNIKCGVLNVGINDKARIFYENGNSLIINVGRKELLVPTVKPKVTLILATPRPLRLERILPIVSCLGVNKLVLVGARKVEKDYFGSHLFRRPEAMRALLVEGLSQAAVDVHVPSIHVQKNFKYFMEDDLDLLDNAGRDSLRLIAHPPVVFPKEIDPIAEINPSQESTSNNQPVRSSSTIATSIRAHELFSFPYVNKPVKHVVVAVGPEGGWEHDEVAAFAQRGFILTSLGDRVLRTDIAIPVLLGMINEWLDKAHTAPQ